VSADEVDPEMDPDFDPDIDGYPYADLQRLRTAVTAAAVALLGALDPEARERLLKAIR
jgi:hypothetical protein